MGKIGFQENSYCWLVIIDLICRAIKTNSADFALTK
jgi:hypothetical protein